jgi:hypothetical protein
MASYAIVAASGGDYTTVQAAHDAAEVAIWVKAGFSGTGFNLSNAGTEVMTGPGVTFTSGINITGNNCSIVGGPGCTVQGEIDVTTGVEAFIEFQNGGVLAGIDINTSNGYVNGGGWGTVSTVSVTLGGSGGIAENIAGSAMTFLLDASGSKCVMRLAKSVASNLPTGDISSSTTDSLVLGCVWESTVAVSVYCITVNADRGRIIGNYGNHLGTHGSFYCLRADNADHYVVAANVFARSTGGLMNMSSSDNFVIVGNRLDGGGGITVSAASTYAANDIEAF